MLVSGHACGVVAPALRQVPAYGALPFGQPSGWLSHSARLAWLRLSCCRESLAGRFS